jgi:ribosome maturation factor RimP
MAEFLLKEIEALVAPVLDEMGIELVDLEYFSGQGRQFLRIYADRPTGITLDDCAMVSREIGHLLDVSDLLQHQYVLEVSSPGLNRPLKRERDFLRVVGQQIKVQTTAPLKGRRNFSGVLQSVENGMLKVDLDDAVVQILVESIRKANLVFDFHNQG